MGIVSTQPESKQDPAWSPLTADRAWGDNDRDALDRVMAKPWTSGGLWSPRRRQPRLAAADTKRRARQRLTGGHGVAKHYVVEVDRQVRPDDPQRLRGEWTFDGRDLKPMKVTQAGAKTLRLSLVEGRKHQIRRVCGECGLECRPSARRHRPLAPRQTAGGSLPSHRCQRLQQEFLKTFTDKPKGRGGPSVAIKPRYPHPALENWVIRNGIIAMTAVTRKG